MKSHYQNQEKKKINDEIIRNQNNWNKLLALYEQHGNNFTIVNQSTLINRLRKFKGKERYAIKNDTRYKKAIDEITSIFSSNSLRDISNARGVANIVHALAKLEEQNQIIFDKVDEEAEYIISNGEPRKLSNIAWYCGTLNIQAPKFFKLLE